MSLTFNPGEPLDVDKLNQLVQMMIDLNKKIPDLTSSTVAYTHQTWSGSTKSGVMPAVGAVGSISIDYTQAGFSATGTSPRVVATPRHSYTGISGGGIKVFVSDVTNVSAKINYVTDNKSLVGKTIYFDWIAAWLKPNA